MLDQKWQKLRNYCARVSRLLHKKQTARQVYAILCGPKSAYGINYDQPCTQSETQYCHILDKLTFWNGYLRLCKMEVKEVAPGELGTYTLSCFSPSASEAIYCRAHILLHWLLKEHRCIRELKVDVFVAYEDTELFFDGLRLSNALRRLELRQGKFEDKDLEWESNTRIQDPSYHLVAAIGTLAGLEELALGGVCLSEEALTLLGAAFENMPCLRSFSAYVGHLSNQGAEIVIWSLRRSKTIKVLHFKEWHLCQGRGAKFAEYLAEHEVLEELTLETLGFLLGRAQELGPLLDALTTNRVLRKLRLLGYFLKPSQVLLLSRVMAVNNTLQSFQSSGEKSMLEGNSLAEIIRYNSGLVELDMKNVALMDVEQLAVAIRTNMTMKKLTLCWSALSLENTTKFCEALVDNCSLQMVTAEDVKEELVADMYKVLRETATEQRMKFKSVFKSPATLQHALENCHELTEVSYDYTTEVARRTPKVRKTWRAVLNELNSHDDSDNDSDSCESRHIPKADDTPDPELSAFDCLTSCSHLVKLEITLGHKMHESCAELLARFLSSTKKLKRAELKFPTTLSATQVLLDALSRNRSISVLALSRWKFRRCQAEEFAGILERNGTLNYLELDESLASFLLHVLSTRVADNKFLVGIKHSNYYLDDEEWMFNVRDALRRNFSLLQRAAHFVMGKHDKRCGEAFEQVSQSAALSERVQQLASESESDVEERIRSSRRHLDVNFLAVAGVVNESVVCDGGSWEQTQLDQIGLDNWLRVRSYLKLTDIKDSPAVAECSDFQ
ncbi:unnamed protein product [Ixodes hexagonus]